MEAPVSVSADLQPGGIQHLQGQAPPKPQTLAELRQAFSIDAVLAQAEQGFTEIVDSPNVINSLVQGVKEGISCPIVLAIGCSVP